MSQFDVTKISMGEIDLELDKKEVDVLLVSLEPELKTPSSDRSSVKISRTRNGIRIIVIANDTSALRAALNSYLRWIQGILFMIDGIV
jgi:tRNA threonylcarbamoyladenosine modification (KEOPS) complex  Pcc1 subunit